MSSLPMPIVMGMVAKCSCVSGSTWCGRCTATSGIAGPMVVAFLLLSASATWGKAHPAGDRRAGGGRHRHRPLGRVDTSVVHSFAFAAPVVQAPVWSVGALVELVVPLAITVLVVQNGQGVAVLNSAVKHQPPVNTIAFVSGIGAALSATVGAVSSCLTGPQRALTSSGDITANTAGLAFGVWRAVPG